MEEEGFDFWIFSLDEIALSDFYAAHSEDPNLYYILYIQKVPKNIPPFVKDVLHLRDNVILLVEHYLMPVFQRMRLTGYTIIMSERFCKIDEYRALLKLIFFYNKPEGIIDMGEINSRQQLCIDLIYNEYHSDSKDSFIPQIIRNLSVNMVLLSDVINVEVQIQYGHLLTIALQFMDLVDTHAYYQRRKSFYTTRLAITEKMLDQSLKQVFNHTFRDIINCRIMIYSMEMLVFTDKTVTQIAHEMDYDVSDFNKLFFRYKGMSPRQLRIEYRKILTYAETGSGW